VSSVAELHQQHDHTAALGQWCTKVHSMVADGASFGTMVHMGWMVAASDPKMRSVRRLWD